MEEKIKSIEEKRREKHEGRLNELVEQGEWEKLKNSDEFQNLSLEGKIIFARKTIINRISQIEEVFYGVVRDDVNGSKPILKRLKYLRGLENAISHTMSKINEENPNQIEKQKKAA